jgi:hypothetical protein
MDMQSLLREIDAEIAKLQHARMALAAIDSIPPKKRRGRPPQTTLLAPKASRKKRTMSVAARAKIAAAQRKRWAKQKASKKAS